MAKQKSNTTSRANNGGAKKGGSKSTSLQPRGKEDIGERLAATPFTFMRRFGEEMDRLFGDFGFDQNWLTPIVGSDLAQALPRGLWSPQVEVFERDNELVVRADLPGLTKDDVKVELAQSGITIEGERRKENAEKGEGFYSSERSYGKFYRRIPVPDGVNAEDAQATFNNGVLEITMAAPKHEQTKSRRLEISDSEPRPKAKGKGA